MHPIRLLVAIAAAIAVAPAQQLFQADTSRPPGYVDFGALGVEVSDIAVADLDGDGVADVLASAGSSIRVLQRAGTSWASTTIAQSGGSMYEFQIGDFDADGLPDILVGPRPGELAVPFVLRNQGGMNFVVELVPFSTVTVGATMGDIDADGDLDLVVGIPTVSGSGIAIARWGPTGFQLDPQPVLLGTPPSRVPRLGDFDGDGDLDIVAMQVGSSPTLLQNQGGLFTDVSASVAGFTMPFVGGRVVDLDGDGVDDLVGAGTRLDVFWGGPAGFAAQTTPVPADCRLVAIGDVDNDGVLDVVAGRATSVVLLRNLGARGFASTPQRDDAVPLDALAVADLDGDGVDDMVCLHGVTGRPLVRLISGGSIPSEDLATTRGVLSARAFSQVGRHLYGDIDGDGRTDCVVTTAATLDVHRSLGQGRYARTSTRMTWPMTAKRQWLVDFDGDGDLDLLRRGGGTLEWLANDGTGNFTTQATQGLAIPDASDADRVGDVDGDGDADLVAVVGNGIAVISNSGGAFAVQSIPVPFTTAPTCIELVDYDLDGNLDIVTDGVFVSTVLLRGTGGGAFQIDARRSLSIPAGVVGWAAGDANGDGIPDLVGRTTTELQALRLWLGDGTGRFVDHTLSRLPSVVGALAPTVASLAEYSIVFADLDGDGRDDLFALVQLGERQEVLLLNDGQRFVDATGNRLQRSGVASFRIDASAVDIDDDGDLDLQIGGPLGRDVLNHTRQLASRVPPRLGATMELLLYSSPGFAPAGAVAVLVSTGAAAQPFAVPGFAGRVDLDLANVAILSVNALSQLGVTSTFAQLPTSPRFLGAELVFQGVVLSGGPQPSGVTNAVREGILR